MERFCVFWSDEFAAMWRTHFACRVDTHVDADFSPANKSVESVSIRHTLCVRHDICLTTGGTDFRLCFGMIIAANDATA
jgi:hypothetical protein